MCEKSFSPTEIVKVESGVRSSAPRCCSKRRASSTSPEEVKRPRPTASATEEAVGHFVALKNREDAWCLFSRNDQTPVNVTWRLDICRWMYKILENDGLVKHGTSIFTWEVAAAAMTYFDRYFGTYKSTGTPPSETKVLLVALSSLRIAIKLYCQEIFLMDFFLCLGRGRFTLFDIVGMEKEILFKLSWRMQPPTAMDFALHFVDLLPSKMLQSHLHGPSTRLLKKHAICDPFFVGIPSSVVAFPSVLNANEEANAMESYEFSCYFLTLVASISPFLEQNNNQVQECRFRLRELNFVFSEKNETKESG